jgi:hypothetical protein
MEQTNSTRYNTFWIIQNFNLTIIEVQGYYKYLGDKKSAYFQNSYRYKNNLRTAWKLMKDI